MPEHTPLTDEQLDKADENLKNAMSSPGYKNLILVNRNWVLDLTADLREARRLLRAVDEGKSRARDLVRRYLAALEEPKDA